MIREIRSVKSALEISYMKEAAEMADRLYEKIPEFIRKSETEIHLAAHAEAFYRNQGHPGPVRTRAFNSEAYYGQITAGPAASRPSASAGPTGGSGLGAFMSQGSGFNRLEPDEPILVDYTSNVMGYNSDQSRIYVKGRLKEKHYRAYRVMLEVQETIADLGKPGSVTGDIYDRALKVVEQAGLSDGFMGHPQPVPFIGHGVGLELDEWPIIGKNSKFILEAGMTMALEPKMVFPGEGVIGIENMFVVGERGLEKLNQYPDEIVHL
jgi:Xaa-Pro aminopeptidase